MKPTAYVETTIPSYLTAWPSRDVVRAGEQQVTRDWWDRRGDYDLRVSSLVLLECQAGDAVNGIAYLVTWNCTHIANATLRPQIEALCRRSGYEPPVICTPRELLDAEGRP